MGYPLPMAQVRPIRARLAGLVFSFFVMGGQAETQASTSESSNPISVEALTKSLGGDGAGEQFLLGYQDGIPFHRVAIKTLPHAEVGIILDGVVDEAVWQTISYYDNMMVAVPNKGVPGEYASEIRMLATEKGLYVSSIMSQPKDTLVKRFTTRDEFIDRDTFGITLDMSGEGLVGYWFIVALGNSLMDGKVLPERNYQRDWDGPWIGKSATRDDGWSVEMFLPWSMMNMPDTGAMRNIGFAASRQVSASNERYQWPGYPYSSSRFVSALNQMDVEGVLPRQQLSFIPYISTTLDDAIGENEARVGVDISWKPSPKFEMTGSLLPDFGAVEADDVVLNLTAAETFFPEKRLFFLEGNEVFDTSPRSSIGNIFRVVTNDDFNTTSRKVTVSDYVPTPISLMNTRRIGGTANQVTVPTGVTPNRGERDRPTDLLGAAKLTGAIGDLRYGVLGAFEDDVNWFGQNSLGEAVNIEDQGRDFAVTRLLYERVGKDKRSIGYLGTLASGARYDAIVHGVDGHYTSSGANLTLDAQVVMSDVDDLQWYGGMFDLLYASSNNLRHKLELDYMNENVNFSDLGFLRRNDYASARYVMSYEKQKFSESVTNFRTTVVLEKQQNVTKQQTISSGIYWRASMILPGRNSLRTAMAYFPRRFEDLDSRGNGAYNVDEGGWVNVNIATDAAAVTSYSASIGAVTEDQGDWSYNGSLGITIRPLDTVSIEIDARYKRRHGWLVYQGARNFGSYAATEWQPGMKFNWFAAPNHQFRLSLQWVGVQAQESGFWEIPEGDGQLVPGTRTKASYDFTVSNVTAQVRYRWEIAPLTDFYLVYNLANALPDQINADFNALFDETFREPTISRLVAKLRYRFGN